MILPWCTDLEGLRSGLRGAAPGWRLGAPPAARLMEVDWPLQKRRRLASDGRWCETLPEDSPLWGLCDALKFFASGTGPTVYGGAGGGIVPIELVAPSTTTLLTQPAAPPTDAWSSSRPGEGCLSGAVARCGADNLADVATTETLLRSLTQLANAAASGLAVRRQLITECQVHVPLLRLMQHPWAQLPHVAERCCRLLHWLCVQAPENREVLAAHRMACTPGSGMSVSFVSAVLGAAEAHSGSRDVQAHVVRALVSFLPSAQARDEFQRAEDRVLSCLLMAWDRLDGGALESVSKWLPDLCCQVQSALGRCESPRGLGEQAAAPHEFAIEARACFDLATALVQVDDVRMIA